MDHLPRPSGVQRYPYDIPVVCTEDYDCKEFSSYPGRHGWDIVKLQAGQFDKSEGLAPFLQTWLYFGLLSEVLNVKITFKDFVTPEGMITSIALLQLIEEWRDRIHAMDEDTRRKEHERVYRLFGMSATVGSSLTKMDNPPPIAPEIVLSISVLVSTLHVGALWIWQYELSGASAVINEWANSPLIMTRMYEDGWCPAVLNNFTNRTNAATLAYIRAIGRPDDADHSKCSGKLQGECVANNVDHTTYKTKHTTNDCDCQFLNVPPDAVVEFVRANSIPVLRLENDEVTVSNARDKDYVAISHVWKDGLGNVGHNSLPTCQLKMIAGKAEEVGCKWFWIDTICVPAELELKAAALSTMDRVYRDARRVLVLDASLRRASCQNGELETYLRIFISGWLTRLWTFQEGALAGPDNLRIVFSDGIVSADYNVLDQLIIAHRAAETWADARSFIISQVPLATLSVLRVHGDPSLNSSIELGSRVTMLWMAVRGRYVTDPSDEFLVFATMLGLDPGSLSLLPREERMRALLNLQEHWPLTLLFADGPRLRKPEYQWAPANFLGSWPGQPGNPTETNKLGLVTNSGLLFGRSGFQFMDTEADSMLEKFMCKIQDKSEWRVFDFKVENNPEDLQPWRTLSPRKGVTTACLIADMRGAADTQWALLVTVNREEDGVIYATYGCRLTTRLSSNAEIDRWSDMLAPWTRPQEEEAQKLKLWPEKDCWEMFGRVQELPETQRWCIA